MKVVSYWYVYTCMYIYIYIYMLAAYIASPAQTSMFLTLSTSGGEQPLSFGLSPWGEANAIQRDEFEKPNRINEGTWKLGSASEAEKNIMDAF